MADLRLDVDNGDFVRKAAGRRSWFLVSILLLAGLTRLYHLSAPITDTLAVKQVYTANKARSVARQPWAPQAWTLDFLNESGERMFLTEEIPVYSGILGIGYRIFGEREWVGRALSIFGTLVALAAFYGLMRREFDERIARAGTVLLAFCPLLVYYGRAVMPDAWMLAGMLLSAFCYRVYLDGERVRWLIAAAVAGLFAAASKYYGLMVLIPLAEMTIRARGWRACFGGRFLGIAAAMTVPIAVWMLGVFVRTPNPITSGWTDGAVLPYLFFQAPGVLAEPRLYTNLFSRFLYRDCGPVALVLVVPAIFAVVRGRARVAPIVGWTVMGLGFYFLFAPKLRDHDYYELMMLPAAATWAALGWKAIADRTAPSARVGIAILTLVMVLHSPWMRPSMFLCDQGKFLVAGRLRELCPAGERVVVAGPGIELPIVVHYSGREGWTVMKRTLPNDWPKRFQRYHTQGARFVAVYFDPTATQAQRESYRPLLASYPTVDRGTGPWSRSGERCDYVVLDIGDERL